MTGDASQRNAHAKDSGMTMHQMTIRSMIITYRVSPPPQMTPVFMHIW